MFIFRGGGEADGIRRRRRRVGADEDDEEAGRGGAFCPPALPNSVWCLNKKKQNIPCLKYYINVLTKL